MYQNEIKELPRLKNENYENIFSVEQTQDSYYYYNLLQTLYFPENLPNSYFIPYIISYGDTWPLISYKTYKNIKLWWLITHANNIINPTQLPPVGTQIKILKPEYVSEILTQIITQED
jgi:nucleoid-associated protein YgaU